MPTTIRSDEPTRQDQLGRDQYVSAFANLAQTCDTPLVIGLYGGWGIGKTSLMMQIQAGLAGSPGVKTVWFNPWQHQFDENLALAFLHTVVDTLGEKDAGLLKEGKKLLTVMAGAFGSMLLKATTSLKLDEIDKLGQRYEEERFQVREAQVRLQAHFRELIEKARGTDGRLVFFIDDLDRCVPTKVLQVLESMNLLLRSSVCVFVLGIDIDIIAEAVQACYRAEHQEHISGKEYLDKIIQLRFPLPPIPANDLEMYLTSLPDVEETTVKSLRLITQTIPTNPRRIKTFLNHVELQWAILVNGGLSQNLDKACLVEWLSPPFTRIAH